MQLQGTMGSSVRYPAVLKVAMTQSKRQQGQEDDQGYVRDEKEIGDHRLKIKPHLREDIRKTLTF